jgi:predicted MFS family arabinose efflux permease
MHLPAAFKRIGWSNLSAQFCEQIALAAAPLAAVLLLGAGPAETGWLQTAQTLPFLLLSIPAGLAVDRTSRRGLMVGAEALRTCSLLAVLLLLATGLLTLPLLAGLGFIGAIGTVCYSVAAPALVPKLVTRGQLGAANRWLEIARSIAFAGGPALGGAIVGWTGAGTAFALAATLSVIAVTLLAGLPDDRPEMDNRRHLIADLIEGARFITGHRLLRPIFLTSIIFNTSWFVIQSIYVAYAIQHLSMTAADVGLTLGVYGVGMILGAGAERMLSRRITVGTIILIGPTCGFVAACVMLATVFVPSIWLAGFSFFLFGVGPILWTISTMTLRQAVTPHAMLGRVSALIMTASFGARPLGAAIGAVVAAQFGTGACLAVAAAGFLGQLMIIAGSKVSELNAMPEPG